MALGRLRPHQRRAPLRHRVTHCDEAGGLPTGLTGIRAAQPALDSTFGQIRGMLDPMTGAAQDEAYSIAELSREFGVTARAIRFYEDKGLLQPTRKGQRRIYSERERIRLLLIIRGKRLGFSLAECRDIIDLYDSAPTEEPQLRRLIATIDHRRRLLKARLDEVRQTLFDLDEVEAEARRLLAGRSESSDTDQRTP